MSFSSFRAGSPIGTLIGVTTGGFTHWRSGSPISGLVPSDLNTIQAGLADPSVGLINPATALVPVIGKGAATGTAFNALPTLRPVGSTAAVSATALAPTAAVVQPVGSASATTTANAPTTQLTAEGKWAFRAGAVQQVLTGADNTGFIAWRSGGTLSSVGIGYRRSKTPGTAVASASAALASLATQVTAGQATATVGANNAESVQILGMLGSASASVTADVTSPSLRLNVVPIDQLTTWVDLPLARQNTNADLTTALASVAANSIGYVRGQPADASESLPSSDSVTYRTVLVVEIADEVLPLWV